MALRRRAMPIEPFLMAMVGNSFLNMGCFSEMRRY